MYFESNHHNECCGCFACADICPTDAITTNDIHNGFYYPSIDYDKCIHCKKCRDVCCFSDNATVNVSAKPVCYYGWNTDFFTRLNSTSGGVFLALVKSFLSSYENGVVYGAAWDESLTVRHASANNYNSSTNFSRSKYIQSQCDGIHSRVKNDLLKGKYVLFSGTPCQVSALKAYLGIQFNDQLLTIDFVCDGVASPIVFKDYLNDLERINHSRPIEYSFRNKVIGKQSQKHCLIKYENGNALFNECDPFYLCYQEKILHRPSCFNCRFDGLNHIADITLGDFWHIEEHMPWLQDERPKGISMIMCNSDSGYSLVNHTDSLFFREIDYNLGLYLHTSTPSQKTSCLFDNYQSDKIIYLLNRTLGLKVLISKRFPRFYEFYKKVVFK